MSYQKKIKKIIIHKLLICFIVKTLIMNLKSDIYSMIFLKKYWDSNILDKFS
jgi:hypothetical protein